jgi:hypothetical protein
LYLGAAISEAMKGCSQAILGYLNNQSESFLNIVVCVVDRQIWLFIDHDVFY